MSKDMMPKRWSVGNYDGYMVERDGGDYVEAEDVEPLLAEITRLRARVDALRWPLAVFIHAHASGSNVPPHIEAAARAALEAKP
jgi:hypothetical protein